MVTLQLNENEADWLLDCLELAESDQVNAIQKAQDGGAQRGIIVSLATRLHNLQHLRRTLEAEMEKGD